MISVFLLVFLSGVLAPSTHGLEKVASGIAALAVAVLVIRTARLGLFAEPGQLVVRNFFWTFKIGWSKIAGFEMPPPYGTWRKAGLRIHLLDGRLISASLYSRGRIDSFIDTTSRSARRVVEELTRLQRERTGDKVGGPHS